MPFLERLADMKPDAMETFTSAKIVPPRRLGRRCEGAFKKLEKVVGTYSHRQTTFSTRTSNFLQPLPMKLENASTPYKGQQD